MRTGCIKLIRTVIHNNPIFVKFELSCIDFLSRLETKGMTLIGIEDNSVIFRLASKTEKIVYLVDPDKPRTIEQ